MGASQAQSPRRSALVAEETRDLILQAAEIEFANRGFARARLEDIAEPVGITREALECPCKLVVLMGKFDRLANAKILWQKLKTL